jgi:acyl-coenzyme A synthetase/AMP-(fatty) acid ligase
MAKILHPGFALIGRTTLDAEALKPRAGLIDVTEEGSRGVVGGLLAAEAGDSAVLQRDTASPPPGEAVPGAIWLQSSGTTGAPKWSRYALADLKAKIKTGGGERARWLLTFHPASFAGVQVILSAMMGGHALVAPRPDATVADMARAAVKTGVTHVSGTPTFWRAFLMALGDAPLALRGVTLGGEAPDQAILDALKARFPDAVLRHIYATTEVGAVFSVTDGRAGFPRNWLYEPLNGLKLTLSEHDTLRVENPRASAQARNGIWDTGDVVELAGDRVLFRGRADNMVNVGGVKVFPETVEAHILASPWVQEARVTSRPNPITGAILIADIVLKPLPGDHQAEIRAHINTLPRAQRPVSLHFVTSIETGATGKKVRA